MRTLIRILGPQALSEATQASRWLFTLTQKVICVVYTILLQQFIPKTWTTAWYVVGHSIAPSLSWAVNSRMIAHHQTCDALKNTESWSNYDYYNFYSPHQWFWEQLQCVAVFIDSPLSKLKCLGSGGQHILPLLSLRVTGSAISLLYHNGHDFMIIRLMHSQSGSLIGLLQLL